MVTVEPQVAFLPEVAINGKARDARDSAQANMGDWMDLQENGF